MLNHATFKASLFMAAGIIDHETGTRDLRRLSGLFRYMPITGTLAMVASAAMAGVPLLNGFLSKEMFFAEAVETHANSWVDTSRPMSRSLGSALAVTYSIRLIHSVFLGAPPESFPREPHEPPFWMRFPVMFLVLACLVVGIVPGLTIGPFLHIAVSSVLGAATPEYSLAVWHGFTLPLTMSAVALAGGALLYFWRRRLPRAIRKAPAVRPDTKASASSSGSWSRCHGGGRALSRRARHPTPAAAAASARCSRDRCGRHSARSLRALASERAATERRRSRIRAGFGASAMVCAVAAAHQAKFHRLAALALLGGAGLGYLHDLRLAVGAGSAATQLLVEIVTTVLILLGLRWLPKRFERHDRRAPSSPRLRRFRDLSLAVVAGAGMSALSYAVMTRPPPDTIAASSSRRPTAKAAAAMSST